MTLSKAALGINLNATYNGTTSYTSTMKTNGLVGGDAVTSVAISSANVGDNLTNYITGVTGTSGNSATTNLLNNYTINAVAKGTATTGNPGATDTNTVTLTKAALGINLNATYNGTTSYTSTVKTNGLVGGDAVTSVAISSANVGDNLTNYITAD